MAASDVVHQPDAQSPDPDHPLIASIVVPVYNGEHHVPGFAAMIEPHVRPDMELVLVDDGSTDTTRQLLEAFVAQSRWTCRLVPLPHNVGLGRARQAGLMAATGGHLVCLDVDDHLVPGALDDVADVLASADADTVLVFDFILQIDHVTTDQRGMQAEVLDGRAATAALLKDEITPYMWNKAIPRDRLELANLSPRRSGEDIPSLVRIFQIHHRVERVPVQFLTYVVSMNSLTRTGDLSAYTSVSSGQPAEIRGILEGGGEWARHQRVFEEWYAPRVLALAGLSAARRTDTDFGEVRRNIVEQLTTRQLLMGIVRGHRKWCAVCLLLLGAPKLFVALAMRTGIGPHRS